MDFFLPDSLLGFMDLQRGCSIRNGHRFPGDVRGDIQLNFVQMSTPLASPVVHSDLVPLAFRY